MLCVKISFGKQQDGYQIVHLPLIMENQLLKIMAAAISRQLMGDCYMETTWKAIMCSLIEVVIDLETFKVIRLP